RVSWKKGSLGYPRQLQETLALLHPGQKVSDLLEKDLAYVADYENNRSKMMFVEDPNRPPYGPFSWDKSKPFTVQRYNFKSQHKPFICFEPGNRMHLRHSSLSSYERARGCNHFPVGQARCDGRTTRMADRPSHCTSFPISDPVIHEDGDRTYWCALYGMNAMSMDELVRFGRSWAYAPELSVSGSDVVSHGYDRSRRCYRLENRAEGPVPLEITLSGSKDRPVIHPALVLKHWNAEEAAVFVDGKKSEACETGYVHKLDGTDLVLFLWLESETPVRIQILPEQ
ncbi:MAG: hypothetical protein ACE5LV_05815, partial [Candidatus Aminicenantales bacterium]